MSEEVAQAAGDLATVEALRARILEWEDTYDRLAGAFDLHMALYECEQAMSAYAALFYDVVLAELAEKAETAEIENAILRDNERSVAAFAERTARAEFDRDEIKMLLIEMRRYFISHNCPTGECVAWTELKKRFDVGQRDEADEAWMRQYTGQYFALRRSADERKRRNRE